MLKFCRDNCIFLHPKEKDQTENKERHICHLFKKRVYHLNEHPKLVTTSRCLFAKKMPYIKTRKSR